MTDQPVQTNILREHLVDYKEDNLMNAGSILLILKDLMKNNTNCRLYRNNLNLCLPLLKAFYENVCTYIFFNKISLRINTTYENQLAL